MLMILLCTLPLLTYMKYNHDFKMAFAGVKVFRIMPEFRIFGSGLVRFSNSCKSEEIIWGGGQGQTGASKVGR
jgi:hypothetical protein